MEAIATGQSPNPSVRAGTGQGKYSHASRLHQQVSLLKREGQYTKAVSLCRKWLTRSPNDWVCWTHLGDLLAKTGDSNGATNAYKRALHGFEQGCQSKMAEFVRGRMEHLATVSFDYRQTLEQMFEDDAKTTFRA